MERITRARALPGYRLWLRFTDGTEGEVDLGYLVGKGVFATWEDPAVFDAVTVTEFGTTEWPGDIDLCPDALYMALTGMTVEEFLAQPKARASA